MSRAETAIDSRLPPGAHSNQRKISIKGLPVYSGALLAQDAPVFDSLATREDSIAFARRLRGQFSIVIEDVATTIAITDFGCSRPVFYIPENRGESFRLASRLEDLVPLSNNEVSREGLFFYVARRRRRNRSALRRYRGGSSRARDVVSRHERRIGPVSRLG
jgi:hypothetical protein